MELILGGAFQGKLTWAVHAYGLAPADCCDLAVQDPQPGMRCYYHLESLTLRHSDPEKFLPLFENAILIAREVGSGVVPLDAADRAWRERHGALLQQLAARAAHVRRIFCGLSEVLK